MDWLLAVLMSLASATAETGELERLHPGAEAFVADMAAEHGMDRERVEALLSQAEKKDSIIAAMTRPAESKPWHEYRKIFMTPTRIAGGVAYVQANRELFDEIEQQYGVPPEIIAAIIGVETRYGQITGGYRVLDALATLAFHYPPRATFFRGELEHFLLLTEEESLPVDQTMGSYAGAMGLGQFIPSSYRAYAVDFDDDGRRDLWSSPSDAIASVANYFHAHRWRDGEPVVARAEAQPDARELKKLPLDPQYPLAQLLEWGYRPVTGDYDEQRLSTVIELEGEAGPEYWIGFHNFYVISRYNRSALYSLAVVQLSQAIAQGLQSLSAAQQ